eukprot:TRINITY_DN1465_c0_g1_i16.p1 TRINITY_DN1465_c0_g1~~TRINITY_DN1465_c0_g1_i16.p1  ORF type:complete len:105 (+),score=1.27 TRINITY_DN1465_c0_g1_i16:394-708(+)
MEEAHWVLDWMGERLGKDRRQMKRWLWDKVFSVQVGVAFCVPGTLLHVGYHFFVGKSTFPWWLDLIALIMPGFLLSVIIACCLPIAEDGQTYYQAIKGSVKSLA